MVHRGEDSSILGGGEVTTKHLHNTMTKSRSPVREDHGPVHLKKVLCSIQICAEADGEKVIRNLLAFISSDPKSS